MKELNASSYKLYNRFRKKYLDKIITEAEKDFYLSSWLNLQDRKGSNALDGILFSLFCEEKNVFNPSALAAAMNIELLGYANPETINLSGIIGASIQICERLGDLAGNKRIFRKYFAPIGRRKEDFVFNIDVNDMFLTISDTRKLFECYYKTHTAADASVIVKIFIPAQNKSYIDYCEENIISMPVNKDFLREGFFLSELDYRIENKYLRGAYFSNGIEYCNSEQRKKKDKLIWVK